MKLITRDGFYFSGKIQDLLKELEILCKKYKTLQEMRRKSIQ
jgi:hypothetical protein